MEDYYKILGVQLNSNPDDIKKAYRKLSLKHHPDRGGDTNVFKKINEAYQTLGDVQKKRMYDMNRNNPLFGKVEDNIHGNPEDIFNMIFGGRQGIPFPFGMMGGSTQMHMFQNGRPVNIAAMKKPAPIVKTIEITLEQAYMGGNFPLKIEKWLIEEGIKKIEHETIYVEIKPGMDDNEILILKNKGNMLSENNIGDVKIFIKVINNSKFKRDGLDLLLTKEITLKEALVGFQFSFKHLSGKKYTINNNADKVVTHSFIKEISNLGMKRARPHPASPLVGNLFICFKVIFPVTLTQLQREQLEKIL